MLVLLLIRTLVIERIRSSSSFRCSMRVLIDDGHLLLGKGEQCVGSLDSPTAWLAEEKYHHFYNLLQGMSVIPAY